MIKQCCPLCGSVQAKFLEKILAKDIEVQYRKHLKIDINLTASTIEYYKCETCHLKYFNPPLIGDSKFYGKLQAFEWYYMENKAEFDIANKYIPRDGTVLEVGAGRAAFAKIVGYDRYVGLEYNDDAITRAAMDGVQLYKESIDQHQLNNNNKYSTVVAFQVLEHIPETFNFIKSCLASLKEEGYLIVAVPNNEGICGLAQNSLLDLPPHHVTHWTKETLEMMAKIFDINLIEIETEHLADYHYSWVMKSIWEKRIRQKLGMRKKLLDVTLISRCVSLLASFISKLFPVNTSSIHGHAIIAIYQK